MITGEDDLEGTTHNAIACLPPAARLFGYRHFTIVSG
jgi:hypothetical protein